MPNVHQAVHDALLRARGDDRDRVIVSSTGAEIPVEVVESHEIREEVRPEPRVELTPGQAHAYAQLLGLVGELATVPFIEGRTTPNPSSPTWPLYRHAVVIADEWEQRRAQKEIRGLLRSGQVSKYELLRAGVR